ncbi:MAG: hypothetical protein J5I98_21260 [Phaeodactylibacter sp.]|nr:hypothetical protein [Phaeodactylibacter sp.]
MRILSHKYLQWRIGQLGSLLDELDTYNLSRLLKALDGLEMLIEDLTEVLACSGNKHTSPYEVALLVEEKRTMLKQLLEEPTGNDEELELSAIHLQRAIYKLARSLQATSAVAFPFSMN